MMECIFFNFACFIAWNLMKLLFVERCCSLYCWLWTGIFPLELLRVIDLLHQQNLIEAKIWKLKKKLERFKGISIILSFLSISLLTGSGSKLHNWYIPKHASKSRDVTHQGNGTNILFVEISYEQFFAHLCRNFKFGAKTWTKATLKKARWKQEFSQIFFPRKTTY